MTGAVEVVRRYCDEIYHEGKVEVIREICADPLVRHDPGTRRILSHQQQIDRISADLPTWQPWFTAHVLAGDDEYVSLVWSAHGRTRERVLSGIEIFRVVDGRITEVWNTPYSKDAWLPSLLDLTNEIDPTWLETALTPSWPGAKVRSFSSRGIGAGNVSDTVLLELQYDHRPDGAPDRVVAKFRPQSPEVHQHGLGSGAYHREIGAYRAITERQACRIPRPYLVAGDETNINLVMEDLTGATAGDQVAGCDIEQATAVLTELARLHATFFPMDDATAPDWPIRMPAVAEYWSDLTRTGSAAALDRYRDALSAEDLEQVAGVAEVVHDWFTLPQRRLTLSHGDPRVDNVLFEQVDGATRAVLIDWQVTGLRNPMYDVGYFLAGSITVEDRRAHEQQLLAHYVKAFGEIRDGYPQEVALEDYRTQVLSGLVITTAAIAVLPDVDVVNRLILALLERNCAATRDWDALAATRARGR